MVIKMVDVVTTSAQTILTAMSSIFPRKNPAVHCAHNILYKLVCLGYFASIFVRVYSYTLLVNIIS